MSKELLYVEWHDANIERITLLLEGQLEIVFKEICTYHKLETGKIENWISRAVVQLTGVNYFAVDNVITDQFIDADLLDSEGKQVELLPGTEKQVACFKIVIAGFGTNIEIKARTARIESLEHLRYLQDWEGDWQTD